MPVLQMMNGYVPRQGLAEDGAYVLGVDLSEEQNAVWKNFTVLREGVYSLKADLSPETVTRKYVDGHKSLPVSDMVRITLKLAAGETDSAGSRILKAASLGENVRCVYADISEGSYITCSMLPRITEICSGELYGMEITVVMTV